MERAIQREPRVTHLGVGVLDERRKSPAAISEDFARGREMLLSDRGLQEVAICASWLELQQPIKTIVRDRTSYGYKHDVEKWSGEYVSNGALIAAALGMGLDFKQDHPGSPNVMLNLSKKQLRAVAASPRSAD